MPLRVMDLPPGMIVNPAPAAPDNPPVASSASSRFRSEQAPMYKQLNFERNAAQGHGPSAWDDCQPGTGGAGQPPCRQFRFKQVQIGTGADVQAIELRKECRSGSWTFRLG